MNKLLLIISLSILASSCSFLKKSTGKQTAAAVSKPVAAPKKEAGSKIIAPPVGSDASTGIPNPSDEVTNVPKIAPEMLYDLQFKYAILLDIPVETMLNHKFIEFMEGWYGTKYKMGGLDKSGIDCSGFALTYMSYFYNVSLPRSSMEQYHFATPISKSELKEGDLVFFKIARKKDVSHVGVYLTNGKFAHASTSNGVIISDLNEPYYLQHFAGCGRAVNSN